MNVSELLSAIRTSEGSLEALDWWLKLWILLVVIGVGVEVVVVLVEHSHEYSAFRKAVISSPGKPSGWMLFWNLLGAGLVAVGVAGELAVHVRAGKIESDLKGFNRALVELSIRDAGEAKERAGSAIERAAVLEKESLVLRDRLRTQGSRASLLMEVSSQHRLASLERFRGQKIEIGQCGRMDNEVTLSVMALMTLLGARGWNVNNFNRFFVCTTGMQVVVKYDAPEPTRAAAARGDPRAT